MLKLTKPHYFYSYSLPKLKNIPSNSSCVSKKIYDVIFNVIQSVIKLRVDSVKNNQQKTGVTKTPAISPALKTPALPCIFLRKRMLQDNYKNTRCRTKELDIAKNNKKRAMLCLIFYNMRLRKKGKAGLVFSRQG